MNLDPSYIMASVLFGVFGTGYFIYGKKNGKPVALVSGILMMVFPYFISDITAIVLTGIGLLLTPFFVKT